MHFLDNARARRRVIALHLLLLLLPAALHPAQAAGPPPARLIVEWDDTAFAAAEVAAAAAGASAASAGGEGAVAAAALVSLASTATAAAAAAGIQVLGRPATYTSVLHGAALRVGSDADAHALHQQLQRNPAVKNVWIAGRRRLVRPVQQGGGGAAAAADEAAAAAAAPAAASATTGSAVTTGLAAIPAYASSTLNGTGVLVCVVDTGIGYRAAAFGSCTGVNSPAGQCSVIKGADFVGDNYSPDSPPVADADPMDCEGHGTMVASVAATSNGVARAVKLGAYRVIGCEDDFTSDDVILQAIDRAVSEGCNIINLSLGSTSGYTEYSLYASVMRNAFNRGVLVVRAAGNSGEDGPFTADGTLASGGISVAAAGYSETTVDTELLMSGYSSFGPAPNLGLLPHVAAPGTNIRVLTRGGSATTASGTSLASPYVAGALALWLQQKRATAAAAGSTLPALSVNQDAAIRGLVTTARPIPDPDNAAFLEPVAKVGAGMLKVDALLANQLMIKPHYLSLPSSLGSGSFSANITLAWQGAAHPSGTLRYSLTHSPATAISLADGWYGTDTAMQRIYEGAQLAFQPSSVSVNTRTRRAVTVQVTFTLPAALQARPLLFSGLIRLLPAAPSGASGAVRPPPLSVPYQGYSGAWSALTLLARVNEPLSLRYSMELTEKAPALCYTPGDVMQHVGMRYDYWSPIPVACTDGGFAATKADVLNVSLAELRDTRGCSLRITLAPQAPVRRLAVELLGGDGAVLGALPTLDVSGADDCLAPARVVGSYCLQFDGSYRDKSGATRSVRVGTTYRLRARLEGPLALADRARGVKARNTMVAIRGSFLVTQ